MKEHLSRRMKKIEEHPGMKQNSREVKVVFVQVDETKDEALIRQGINPEDPGVDLIIVRFVRSPNENMDPTGKPIIMAEGKSQQAQDHILQED